MRPAVRAWFEQSFAGPTRAQELGMPPVAAGQSTLLLAPTGSGKTLAAFLAAIERVMFEPRPAAPSSKASGSGAGRTRAKGEGRPTRVLYVSPLKALAVDVEKNLRAPIVGITRAAAALNIAHAEPTVFVRSGDTPARERAAFLRHGADIVITTPESLYLMLTSDAHARLASVETVIVDEIHAIAGTKRGAHLWLSLERLEALRPASAPPLQRIGLSATVRPLEAVAALLGGFRAPGEPRPVTIVDAGTKRALDLTIEVPVEDMRNLSERDTGPSAPAPGAGPPSLGGSIWPSIFPRLLELIRAHRTTLMFVNNRRLAERIAQALNDLAGEQAGADGPVEVALAHHGSIAHDRRVTIEDRLKAGAIPAIVATSSLELGIDMGAVDLVVQIESPPSVAAGLQRVGRAGHHVGAVSKGVIVPKFRADLLACAATARAMQEGEVEATGIPQNALDVLAQQIVAIASMGPIAEADLFALVRRAAPYQALARGSFEGVLDMLAGRYPSDEFAELRPRVIWDRVRGLIQPRHGTRRLAILSGGTIPDRGLFGVFLDGAEGKPVRIGELDEEMVFESRVGDVFLLGASSWRITEITHDRVLAVPAPGEAGRMPFWRGDKVGRPAELGRRIGALARTISGLAPKAAQKSLETEYGLDRRAAKNLITYVGEQREATGEVPSDRCVVIERFLDELGDQRVCVLCPLGARVLAPWAMAVTARLAAERGLEVEAIWSDDGIVFRVADVDAAPEIGEFVPAKDEAEELIVRGLDKTAMFAARFRENAGRSLLLPRQAPGKRQPLWTQRKRSAELLAVASRYPSFPLVLETFRECLKDTLDIPSLLDLLGGLESRAVRLVTVDSTSPSPFAASLLFSYVANFIYEGDAPLAERRAQALALDQERLRELLGEVELRELLDEDALREAGDFAAYKRGGAIAHADHLHDLLLAFGDLDAAELRERVAPELDPQALVDELCATRRAARVTVAGEARVIAVEDVARYRDALGVAPPPGVPVALLGSVEGALLSLVARFSRTRGPFTVAELARRFGLGRDVAQGALRTLGAQGKLVHGSFTPGGPGEEWVDAEVLRAIKRRSLAKLRKAVEPVPVAALARFLGRHHGVTTPRRGHEALLAAIEQLEGCPLPVSVWLEDVLPARVREFSPLMLDELCAAGEIVWRGLEPIATNDGRVSFYLADRYALLAPPPEEARHELTGRVEAVLERRGAIFFHELAAEVGGFAGDVLDALWDLVWAGRATNDTTAPLRSKFGVASVAAPPGGRALRFRSRRTAPPGSEGRFSLLRASSRPATDRLSALTELLLERHGVVTREVAQNEPILGGFGAVYPVLRAMEEAGRARRGYFVEGLGAAQFARAGTEERLRAVRDGRAALPELGATLAGAPLAPGEELPALVLAALDPANPYGSVVPWPASPGRERLARTAGAYVVLIDGVLAGYVPRGEQALVTFLPATEPERGVLLRALAAALAAWIDDGQAGLGGRSVLQLARLDQDDAAASPLAAVFREVGFVPSGKGLLRRRDGSFARPRRARR